MNGGGRGWGNQGMNTGAGYGLFREAGSVASPVPLDLQLGFPWWLSPAVQEELQGWLGFPQLQFSRVLLEQRPVKATLQAGPPVPTLHSPHHSRRRAGVQPVHRAQQEWETRNNKHGRGVLGPLT